MTETTELTPPADRSVRRNGAAGGLASMVLADLKVMASDLGIKGISGMRKGDLVAAIIERRGTVSGASAPTRARRAAGRAVGAPDAQPTLTDVIDGSGGRRPPAGAAHESDGAAPHHANGTTTIAELSSPAARPPADGDGNHVAAGTEQRPHADRESGRSRRDRRGRHDGDARAAAAETAGPTAGASGVALAEAAGGQGDARTDRGERTDRAGRGERTERTDRGDRADRNERNDRTDRNERNDRADRDDADGSRRRGRRYRDRNRRGRDRFSESNEPEIGEDDVLVPVSGVVDVLDSYAFVRTSGYLAGPKDVYVSMSQVRKYGLRRGDMITGSIKAQREGQEASSRQKFTPLAKLDTINGLDPELMKGRPEFTKLTPLYPNERLRLETEPHIFTTRVIDLVMPVGKGQRALIVSPPKAGKTSILQAIANAISTNNPECHLMVVLVDERPEEVTDMQRSVKGEVIASTFDRPPSDHTSVAELSIERAKRLVEMGRDVVVLLDSITRLGRAYNLAAPASGRILSGGVDSTALFPPKRFLGAARNIENGGSLTIFASALVETGSAGDTVIFEEFKGTGNAELKLDRRLADKRLFPAIDIDASSTRKEELLLSPDELAVTVKLRRVLAALEPQQALEVVLDKLRKTRTNIEFLMTVAKNMPLSD